MHHVAITTFGWALPTGTGWTNTVTGTQTIKLPLECVFVKARIQQSESRSMLRCVDSDGRKDGQWEMSVSTAEKSMPIFLLQQHRPKVTSVHFSPFLICSIQPFILSTHCLQKRWTKCSFVLNVIACHCYWIVRVKFLLYCLFSREKAQYMFCAR